MMFSQYPQYPPQYAHGGNGNVADMVLAQPYFPAPSTSGSTEQKQTVPTANPIQTDTSRIERGANAGTSTAAETDSNVNNASPSKLWIPLLGLIAILLIICTGLLINLTVRDDDGSDCKPAVAVGEGSSTANEDNSVAVNSRVDRRDYAYVILADAVSVSNINNKLLTLTLQRVATPVVSFPTGAQHSGPVLHHVGSPRSHVEENPAGPNFYGARPSAVLLYTATDGQKRRTTVRLGVASWLQDGSEDVIEFQNAELSGKTGLASATMEDVDAENALEHLLAGASVVALEVLVPSSADCGVDPSDEAECVGRLSDWPVTSRQTEQCEVIYEAISGSSSVPPFTQFSDVETMDACMAECCSDVMCKAIAYSQNENLCGLLAESIADGDATGLRRDGGSSMVADRVFDTSVTLPGTTATVLEASDLELKQRFYNARGVVCTNYSAGFWHTCGCVEGFCSDNGVCTHTPTGSFCECDSWRWDGERCDVRVPDVDECAAAAGPCDENAECTNTDGSFTCTCNPGYESVDGGLTCVEGTDECAEEQHNCDANAACTNTLGSFSCACAAPEWASRVPPRWAVARVRVRAGSVVDQITFEYSDGQTQSWGQGSTPEHTFELRPDQGQHIVKIDTVVGERLDAIRFVTSDNEQSQWYGNPDGQEPYCSLHIGRASERNCNFFGGTWFSSSPRHWQSSAADPIVSIERPAPGSRGLSSVVRLSAVVQAGTVGTCQRDECATGEHDCGGVSLCIDTQGGFGCICPDGFVDWSPGQRGRSCDRDQCADGAHQCADDNMVCEDKEIGWECPCREGWSRDGTVCSNVDECALGTHDCDAGAVCTDGQGSFVCTCNEPSFVPSAPPTLAVAEVRVRASIWLLDQIEFVYLDGRVKTIGSRADSVAHNTRPETPFRLDGSGGEVIVRIETRQGDLWDAMRILTSRGRYSMWYGSPAGGNGRDYHGSASDPIVDIVRPSEQAFARPDRVQLLSEFIEAGTSGACEEDECASGAHNCDDAAACTNTLGSFLCSCNTNFVSEDNGVTCLCPEGYAVVGAEAECLNVDECLAGTHDCDAEGAVCTDTEGSFTCACDAPTWVGSAPLWWTVSEVRVRADAFVNQVTFVYEGGGSQSWGSPEGAEGIEALAWDLGERLVRMDTRQGDSWDAVRFVTNMRTSRWYGTDYRGRDVVYHASEADPIVALDRQGGSRTRLSRVYQLSHVLPTGTTGACDKDECTAGLHNCDARADCRNTYGSFVCFGCDAGFEMASDGVSCTDVDECSSSYQLSPSMLWFDPNITTYSSLPEPTRFTECSSQGVMDNVGGAVDGRRDPPSWRTHGAHGDVRPVDGGSELCQDRRHIVLELDAPRALTGVTFWQFSEDARSYSHQVVLLSADGANWEPVFACGTEAECGVATEAGTRVTFPPHTARYVVVESSNSNLNVGVHILEVAVEVESPCGHQATCVNTDGSFTCA